MSSAGLNLHTRCLRSARNQGSPQLTVTVTERPGPGMRAPGTSPVALSVKMSFWLFDEEQFIPGFFLAQEQKLAGHKQ